MIAKLFALLPLLALASAGPITKRATGQLIQTGRSPGECISAQGGRSAVDNNQLGDGTGVTAQSCDSASLWDISKGSASVVVTGTNYALDIGLNPGNNGGLKVWTSYPGAPQQTWYLTDDNRIAQTGGDQCLDLGDNGLQTYQCTAGNINQVFNVGASGTPAPSSASSAAPSPSTTTSSAPASSSTDFNVLPNIPRTEPFPDVPGTGVRIRPEGRRDLCVGVTNDYAGVGSPVAIVPCLADDSGYADLQLWDLNSSRYGGSRQVQLVGHPELCLDAGTNPGNGSGMKVWTCGDNLPKQQWSFNAGRIPLHFQTANNQCLDIKKESSPRQSQPYDSYADLQTWECSTNVDPYQSFQIQYLKYDNM